MSDKTLATILWENNADTPISADNLSQMLVFQASQKFIDLTDTPADYTAWADSTLSQTWPDLTTSWDPSMTLLNKKIYNFFDGTARMYTFNSATALRTWVSLPTPKGKIVKIIATCKFALPYVDVAGIAHTAGLQFNMYDSNTKNVTIDDLIGATDYTASTQYLLMLVYKWSLNGSATLKIIPASILSNTASWNPPIPNSASPTGNDVVAYLNIGGFLTNADTTVNKLSIWDMYTYKPEIIATSYYLQTPTGVRPMNSTDIPVADPTNILNSQGQNLSIETAVIQTRELFNALKNQIYVNRRFGMALKYTHLTPTSGGFALGGANALPLMITAGYTDVAGVQITESTNFFFNTSTFSASINGGAPVTAPLLAVLDTGNKDVIYPGVWRVFMDYLGNIFLYHDSIQTAYWMPQSFGWYSPQGYRCLGKFRVISNNGVYVERLSVTDTEEGNIPANTITVIFGTVIPDGLLPCDGLWHDINGYDTNAYTWAQLINAFPTYAWGNSWYENTPNYTGAIIKGASYPIINVTGGAFNTATGAGAAADYGNQGGSATHTHNFSHQHGPGTLNILPSGPHSGHQVQWNGSGIFLDVTNVPLGSGQAVSENGHVHSILITGGEHTHSSADLAGATDIPANGIATDPSSTWPPYVEALICIKK